MASTASTHLQPCNLCLSALPSACPHVSATFHRCFNLRLPASLKPHFCVAHDAGLLKIQFSLKPLQQEIYGSSHTPCSQISLGARLTGRKSAGTKAFPHSLTVTCLAFSPCHSRHRMMMNSSQLLIGPFSLKGALGPCQNLPCHLLPALIKRLLLPFNPRSMRPYQKAVLNQLLFMSKSSCYPANEKRCHVSITKPCTHLVTA